MYRDAFMSGPFIPLAFLKKLLLLSFSLLLACISLNALGQPKLEFVSTGSTPQYAFRKKYRQDLSASAYYNGTILFGFDGGKGAEFPEVRLSILDDIENPAIKIRTKIVQRDIEGATNFSGRYIFSSSLSHRTNTEFQTLVSFKVNEKKEVIDEKFILAREAVLNALFTHFNHDEWASRVVRSKGKAGGLNLEALSTSHKQGDHLVMGLRSPLWHPNFGDPQINKKLTLTTGHAILVNWQSTLSDQPFLNITTIDLNHQGIRGMEYIPSLRGYLIIAGPVEKAKDFSLWIYDPFKHASVRLALSDQAFKKLCRPESILHIEEKARVFVLSEESGKNCANSKYNFVEYKY